MLDFKLGEDFFKDEERSGFEIGSLMKRCWFKVVCILRNSSGRSQT